MCVIVAHPFAMCVCVFYRGTDPKATNSRLFFELEELRLRNKFLCEWLKNIWNMGGMKPGNGNDSMFVRWQNKMGFWSWFFVQIYLRYASEMIKYFHILMKIFARKFYVFSHCFHMNAYAFALILSATNDANILFEM